MQFLVLEKCRSVLNCSNLRGTNATVYRSVGDQGLLNIKHRQTEPGLRFFTLCVTGGHFFHTAEYAVVLLCCKIVLGRKSIFSYVLLLCGIAVLYLPRSAKDIPWFN